MGGHWVVYKITSGNVVEKTKVWRTGRPAPRRRRIKGNAGLKKLEANMRAAVKALARILNCNFSHKDLFISAKYDDAHLPADWQANEKARRVFINRLKKRLKKAGVGQVKWISVCSETSPETGAAVRPHVHIVISGDGIVYHDGAWWIGEERLDDIWGQGGIYAEPLRQMSDYTQLAVYLLRQAGRETDRKKYHVSRNMTKPIVEEYEARTDRELRSPAGAVVKEKRYDDLTGANYIRYIKPPRKARTRSEGRGGADHETE